MTKCTKNIKNQIIHNKPKNKITQINKRATPLLSLAFKTMDFKFTNKLFTLKTNKQLKNARMEYINALIYHTC